MQDFAQRYTQSVNAIIFSGMCDDGVIGSQQVIAEGGEVWIQSPDTCVVGSMPENVDKTTKVSFSGTPEMLAKLEDEKPEIVMRMYKMLAQTLAEQWMRVGPWVEQMKRNE